MGCTNNKEQICSDAHNAPSNVPFKVANMTSEEIDSTVLEDEESNANSLHSSHTALNCFGSKDFLDEEILYSISNEVM